MMRAIQDTVNRIDGEQEEEEGTKRILEIWHYF